MVPPNPLQSWSRRRLLRLAALSTASAALSVACERSSTSGSAGVQTSGFPEAKPRAPENPGSGITRIALILNEDRAAGTHQAIDLLQPTGLEGKSIFLKPNFNTADPAPAATDPALLEALVRDLQNASTGTITIGDRSGMADSRSAMESKGVFRLADRLGLQALVLDELEREQWLHVPAEGTHWPRGYAFARPALDADAVVSTCCLKTHRFGGQFTLSLKNTVGLVAKTVPGDSHNYMGDLHSSPYQRQMIAEVNQAYTPALVLLDAVEAFVNGGPDRGEIARPNVTIAGTDRVAVDVVGIALLRLLGTTPAVSQGSIWELDQIQRAVELNLGVDRVEKIDIVTADAAGRKMADQIRRIMSGEG